MTQMATIASPLLQRRKEPDEEQLLKLFWNRAELKKELAKLRREKDGLLDQLRQQEAVNLRTHQRLEQLETLLADPLQAVNAVIYYQLRGIWQQCRKRLQRVARELTERQQERERQYAQGLFERRRNGELAAIDEKLSGMDSQLHIVGADLQAVQQRHRQLRGFWNYFRRRAAAEQCEAMRAALEGLQTQIERLKAARSDKELEAAPGFAGLSLDGRRNINLAIVAMAQQLLVHFADHNVAGLSREAAVRSLDDISYGNAAQCHALGESVEAVVRKLDAADKLTAQMRRRAEFLKLTAHYRRETDTVPVASSFSSVPVAITAAGELRPADDRVIQVNVLADEYWDIYTVLLN
jgi:hypothetical protein